MKITSEEFYYFCKEEYEKEYLLEDPDDGMFTTGFVNHLNDFIKEKIEQANQLDSA